MKDSFSEYEWVLVAGCPIFAAHTVFYADIASKEGNFEDSLEIIPENLPPLLKESLNREILHIYSNIGKYAEYYTENQLVRLAISDIEENSIPYYSNRLNELAEKKAPYPLTEAEISSVNEKTGIITEGNLAEIIKGSYFTFICSASLILDKKNIPESREYKNFVYRFAEDTAKAASESFFGFGRKISKKEAEVLSFLQRILFL